MLRSALAVVAAFVQLSRQDAQTCYVVGGPHRGTEPALMVLCLQCASESLSSRWQVTGLPRIQDSYFTDCSAQTVGKLQTESCTGGCFTYMFEDPDIPTKRPTQVVSNRTSSTGGASYCEYDATHQMANSKGDQVSVRSLTEFCSTTNCNSRQSTSNSVFSDCNQQTVDNLLGGEVLNCFECSPREGSNCHDKERKCSSKKYCSKQTVQLGGGWQVVKSCSNINILGVDNGCATYDVVTNPGGVAVRSKYTQCYCRNKQFCNSVPTLSAALTLATVSTSLLFVWR
ncbi:unnamed protein product [Nippostrongylus brasiliensis]|uniref:UPAR/Ly6 domain-containing protein n=1 Tax=Nippostrongylus brasiliensis TaxID=27835 RepID=A0A158R172_NIPBR|nr:unnamed protein product [Nippostrongylus brasiliensis]